MTVIERISMQEKSLTKQEIDSFSKGISDLKSKNAEKIKKNNFNIINSIENKYNIKLNSYDKNLIQSALQSKKGSNGNSQEAKSLIDSFAWALALQNASQNDNRNIAQRAWGRFVSPDVNLTESEARVKVNEARQRLIDFINHRSNEKPRQKI